MVTSNGFRSHILQLLADQKAKKAEIEASIRRKLDEADAKIAALEMTLAIYEESHPSLRGEVKLIISPEEVRANAKTQKEALKFIASRNDGLVRYTEARDILVAAKMTRGKARNIAVHLYNLMANSEEWEKISPGVFQLLSSEQKAAPSSTTPVTLAPNSSNPALVKRLAEVGIDNQ